MQPKNPPGPGPQPPGPPGPGPQPPGPPGPPGPILDKQQTITLLL